MQNDECRMQNAEWRAARDRAALFRCLPGLGGGPTTTAVDRQEHSDVEARTREIGREVFRRAMEDEPSVMSADWWDERMMALTMRDERLAPRETPT